ncbi:hypothetical protein [Brevundimonas sp.]|uniref:beta family protein n=1 Tax=Brevundimonas sp. TaxID=1871086 RepID=UPI001222D4E4|nr:hypothetical protein [Brevundimonas sp.]TAJ63199.1 MAG: hypothetical protein EPO49_07330 [Brevundimonas sp.]
MYPVEQQIYGPILMEKWGEVEAARKLHRSLKPLMLATWVALPLKKGKPFLRPDELVKREVGLVRSASEDNVCCWDPRHLVMADDPARDAILLNFLLRQFVEYGCRVVPVASLRESYSRLSVMAEHSKRAGSGIAIRLKLEDLEEYDLLDTLLDSTGLTSADCMLLIDLGQREFAEHDEFAAALIRWVDALHERGNWAKIVVAATSYPLKNPAPDNGEVSRPRAEWLVWKWALELDPDFGNRATFGDFGADCEVKDFGSGGIPIPHIRYALENAWRIVRGIDFPSMRNVMRRAATAPQFMGRAFSAGDEFIADCASGVTENCGSASHWRFANMNHHITLALTALAQIYGVGIIERVAHNHEQPSLIGI